MRLCGPEAVTVTKRGVYDFARRWPCANFPDKAVSFVFSGGDLVDILPYGWDSECDGAAVCALAEDAKSYLERKRKGGAL